MEKRHIFDAFRHALRPLLRFLLRHGITWDEFAGLAKESYVDVARETFGLQGRPTNNARVAMMTGLSRREVARIRDRLLEPEADPAGRTGNRVSRILTGWHADDEFTDENGVPKLLPAEGETGSLQSLLSRYAGDLPHSAVRKEMLQKGLMEVAADGAYRVLKRDYTYSALNPEVVQQMSVALHDHAATLEHNLNEAREGPRRFEGLADNASMSARSAQTFMQLVESRGLEFLQEMDLWLSAHEQDRNAGAGKKEVRMGVGVYLIYEDN